ncbi:sulfotransferase [Tritonibacter mobilis]|uniref:sulfotransferase n=1 Tax=Tritonibacter mobilis TaxID=379347 RepID=UPI00398FCB3F
MPQTLIIGGCARSGTTGFRSILAQDDRLAIGLERYLKHSINNRMTADLWSKERFADVQPDDTHVQPGHPSWSSAERTIQHAYAHYDDLVYIGDKLPRSGNNYETLHASAPKTKVLYMLRNPFDVAASYNKRARNENDKGWRPAVDYRVAVDHWNLDVSETVKYLDKLSFHIIRYETIFYSLDEFQAVYDFLNLTMTDSVASNWQNARKKGSVREQQRSALTDDEKVYICAHCDFTSYRKLLRAGGHLE